MTTSITNLKRMPIVNMHTVMFDLGNLFIIQIINPTRLTRRTLNRLRALDGKINKRGVQIVVNG